MEKVEKAQGFGMEGIVLESGVAEIGNTVWVAGTT